MDTRRGIRRSEIVPPERDQPFDVPFREVTHQDHNDGYIDIRHIGTSRETEYYGSEEEWQEELEDLRRRDLARKKLGGFGFRV
jgi:hypothetical protein